MAPLLNTQSTDSRNKAFTLLSATSGMFRVVDRKVSIKKNRTEKGGWAAAREETVKSTRKQRTCKKIKIRVITEK
jgi:hypothetical protein